MTKQLFAAAVILCVGLGCTRRAEERFHGVPLAPSVRCATPDCRSYNVLPYVLTRSKYGIGCLGNVPPGTTPNPEPPPQSFSAADIGKPGMRRLSADQARLVDRVRRYIHSKTLRIAWVDDAPMGDEFIVFDATSGPCSGGSAYAVLNGSCNEFYEPGEDPYHTLPRPGCIASPRPWLSRSGNER